MKRRANIPIAKLIKNDLISKFIINTMKDKNMTGAEQYKIKHKVCIIGLNYAILLHL